MADTDFDDGSGVIAAAWLDDINDAVYTGLGAVAGTGAPTKLQFPAVQVPSADANALDDYEEGNCNSLTIEGNSVAGAQTYTNGPLGRYTKVGRMVHVSGFIQMTAKDAATSGDIRIVGLPFTASNVSNMQWAISISSWKFDLGAGMTQVGGHVIPNTNQIQLTQSGDNTAPASLTDTNLLASTQFGFSVSYNV